MMLLATRTQGPWLFLRLPFSEACPRTSESLANSCVALNHPGTLARGLHLGGGGARVGVYRVGRPAWRHRARGGAGAGPGWTSAPGGRRPAAPIQLRASVQLRELRASVGRHGAACGRVRPGRGPGGALGGRRVGPHRGVGAAQVRGPAPGRSGRVGAAGGGPPAENCLWALPALVSHCCRARALQRLKQLPGAKNTPVRH